MSVEVSLISKGRIEAEDVSAFLSKVSGRPTEICNVFTDENSGTDYFNITFRSPLNRRYTRTLRAHHSTGGEDRYAEHVGDGEYTYMVLGAHQNGESIMRMLAEEFGGYLENDEDESIEYIDAGAEPLKSPMVA